MDEKKELQEKLEIEKTDESAEELENEALEDEDEEEEKVIKVKPKPQLPKIVYVVYKGPVSKILAEGFVFKNGEPQSLLVEVAEKICKKPHFYIVKKIKERKKRGV